MLFFGCLITILASCWAEILEDDIHRFIREDGFNFLYGDETDAYEIITPIHSGHTSRRSADEHPEEINYIIPAFGRNLKLNLKKSTEKSILKLVSREDGQATENLVTIPDCYYHGNLGSEEGWVAASLCDGMSAIIRSSGQDYVVHALPKHLRNKRDAVFAEEIQHVVYKKRSLGKHFCGASSKLFSEAKSTIKRQANSQQARKLTVETALFVDTALYRYFSQAFGRDTDSNILLFALSITNAVQHMYNYQSMVGKAIVFVVIRVEILKNNPIGLRVVDEADQYLWNFCSWQSTINPGDDSHPDHWDHTFLFTGIDIKSNGNSGTIGIAPLRGMCNPNLSCTVTEARFFQAVITGAHEAGHNFGMEHDGDGNNCDNTRFIMAPMAGEGQTSWSACSRNYMLGYLGWPITVCLLDERRPINNYNHEANDLPGQIYDADVQCKWAFGERSQRDRQRSLIDICDTLRCEKDFYVYVAHSALEGSFCAPNSWCRGGRCINWGGYSPRIVNGGWSDFSGYSRCESECIIDGSGIELAYRNCDSPRAENGGEDCKGDQITAKLCDDTKICSVKISVQQYGNEICAKAPGNIKPVVDPIGLQLFDDKTGGCLVWCQKKNQPGSYTGFGEPYPDGTNCSQGNGRAYCIKGICRKF